MNRIWLSIMRHPPLANAKSTITLAKALNHLFTKVCRNQRRPGASEKANVENSIYTSQPVTLMASFPCVYSLCRGLVVPGARIMCFPHPEADMGTHIWLSQKQEQIPHRVPPSFAASTGIARPKPCIPQEDGRHRDWSTARLWPLHKTKETDTGTSKHKLPCGTWHDAIENGRGEGHVCIPCSQFSSMTSNQEHCSVI